MDYTALVRELARHNKSWSEVRSALLHLGLGNDVDTMLRLKKLHRELADDNKE